MQEVILMPRLSDTMTEGVIAAWHKKVGDDVKKGDLLADVETDKATMELESYKTGKLLYIGAEKGDKVPVNALLCIIGEEGKVDINKIVAAAKGGTGSSAGEESAQQQTSSPAAESGQSAASTQTSAANVAVSNPSMENGRVKASPLAKKLAAEKGIDIATVSGSGDNGRIIKADIDNFKPGTQPATQRRGAGSHAGPLRARTQLCPVARERHCRAAGRVRSLPARPVLCGLFFVAVTYAHSRPCPAHRARHALHYSAARRRLAARPRRGRRRV
ncbi:MAG: hypothetical protein EOP49_18380 [Sphingobacteriales bacterium]|nr:MAG: hypothetical protein EOP49_18380 [Sphingobacteriales bacterium]